MMTIPEIPILMLVTLMDKYGLKSRDVRQRWSDAYKAWLSNEMRVYHNWFSQGVMDAVYLRVIYACEPEGPRKSAMQLASAELALRYRQKN